MVVVQFEGQCAWVIDIVWHKRRTVEQIVRECASKPWAANVKDATIDPWGGDYHSVTGDASALSKWRALWWRHAGKHLPIYSERVGIAMGYDIHDKLLLNSWDPEDARDEFGEDIVVDPDGPRIMFHAGCEAPLFGGTIDGEYYDGEYVLHKTRVAPDGTVISDMPKGTDDDAVKAINYGAYVAYGVKGLERKKRGGSLMRSAKARFGVR